MRYFDINRWIERTRVEGCERCGGRIEIGEVASDRWGLYLEATCKEGGEVQCAGKVQRVRP